MVQQLDQRTGSTHWINTLDQHTGTTHLDQHLDQHLAQHPNQFKKHDDGHLG